jgi:hypothetical protein
MNDIKFETIKLLNGIRYLSNEQTNDFKSYVRHHLKLEDIEENNKLI